MSKVKRFGRIGDMVEATEGLLKLYPMMSVYILAEDFDRVTAERDALRAKLAERECELEEFATEMTLAITDSQIRSAMTVIGRSRFLQLLQTYNARIDCALSATTKPEPDHE